MRVVYIITCVGNKSGGVPERPKGTDCKSVGSAFEGSNPSPSIYIKYEIDAIGSKPVVSRESGYLE